MQNEGTTPATDSQFAPAPTEASAQLSAQAGGAVAEPIGPVVAAPEPDTNAAEEKADPTATPPKKPKDQRASVQNHLQFAEIRDGIIIMRDGSLRMVILASALNFDLKSPQEQSAIEFSYQGFINGLHFPIQILIRSRKIDLDGYLDKLQKLQADQQNPLLGGLMEDYIENIKILLDEVNIMDKEFYVIVPYFVEALSKENLFQKLGKLIAPNADYTMTDVQFGERKRDLIQRTNLVAQGLAQLGIRVAVLSTQEIIELLYSAYNIDEAQAQALINVNDLTTPVVQRGGGEAAPYQPGADEATEPNDLFAAAQAKSNPAPEPAPDVNAVAASSPIDQLEQSGRA